MALNGTYKAALDSPMGKQEAMLSLTAEGAQLSGSIIAMGNTLQFDNGKADGDAFEFVISIKSPMGAMEITVNGTVEGDLLKGTFKMPFGESAFEGVRVS
jgi:hypothetical protein